MSPRLFALAPLVLVLGCGAGRDVGNAGPPLGDPNGADTGGGFVDPGDGGFVIPDTATGPGNSDCPDDLKQVYAVTEGNELYQFAPATSAFKKIGDIDCNDGGANPFSMAVDRTGMAWVLFDDGKIFHVSTKDASCTATAYAPPKSGKDFFKFGMAFVADAAGSSAETLFIADYNGTGISKIDTTTLQRTFVGGFGQAAGAGELTGTGDARMYAFFDPDPTTTGANASVAQLDHASGKILSIKQLDQEVGAGWAFAFWGGDFYLFTAPGGSSIVTQYDYTTGTGTTVVDNTDFVIVGAGVSTCAPTERPK